MVRDLLPTIQRTDDNALTLAKEERDRIYRLLEEVCQAKGVEILLLKSEPYGQFVSIRTECWRRHPEDNRVSDRRSAFLIVRPVPYHEWDTEIDIVFFAGPTVGTVDHIKETTRWWLVLLGESIQTDFGDLIKGQKWTTWHKTVSGIYRFERADAEALVQFLVGETRLQAPQFFRCRHGGWRLWLPKNHVKGLQKDWGRWVVNAGVVFGLFLIFIAPGLMPVEYDSYGSRVGSSALTWIAPVFGVALVGGVIWWNKRRISYALLPGKPEQEPRYLVRLDSWQTMIFGGGERMEQIQQEIQHEIREAHREGIICEKEHIWHWGLDGKEEREQIVVRFRRSIAFIHVYCYGDDLYIGWDAHLNRGTWVEEEVSRGIEPRTGVLCRACTIVSGIQPLTEYDVTDANSLIEWVHGAATKVARRLMAELKSDQEIDFTIQREERRGIAAHASTGAPKRGRRH